MLLDTDVLIDLERKHPAADAWFQSLTLFPSVPGFAVMEMINGCQNSTELNRVLKFLQPLPVLWPSEKALGGAISSYALLRLGHGIGILDMLIASVALTHAMPLVTFNVKHYRNVPGLATVQPYVR